MSLSDKIGNFNPNKVNNNLLWTKDVKEFIKRLKDEFVEGSTTWNNSIHKRIDKLAGEELT